MSTSTKTMAAAQTKNRTKIRVMAQIGMLSAIALVLMLFEIPLPFAPSFYEIDFSEVPVLVQWGHWQEQRLNSSRSF